MKKLVGLLLVLVLVVALAKCARGTDATGLAEARFIEVIVALRQAAPPVGDPDKFAARKEQILQEAGVTEEQLRAYIKAHERDLDHMAAVWESINVRLAAPPEDVR